MEQYLLGKALLNRDAAEVTQNGASFRIHYWGVIPYHYDTSLHEHFFAEICYVLDGEGMYIDDGQTFPIKKGTLFLSKPRTLHQIKSEEGLFLLYVGFELIESASNEDWVNQLIDLKECSEVHAQLQEMNEIVFLWQSLLLYATRNGPILDKAVLNSIAFSLLATLIQVFCPTENSNRTESLDKASSKLLFTVKAYIRENISQTLLLSDIADRFHLSERHLSRLFQAEEGVGYSTYVKNERIQRAATLLKSTDDSIKEIAKRTGFASVHYFTRVFTEKLSCSPGAFRTLYTDVRKTSYTNNERLSR